VVLLPPGDSRPEQSTADETFDEHKQKAVKTAMVMARDIARLAEAVLGDFTIWLLRLLN
jgi:hypothetical protein